MAMDAVQMPLFAGEAASGDRPKVGYVFELSPRQFLERCTGLDLDIFLATSLRRAGFQGRPQTEKSMVRRAASWLIEKWAGDPDFAVRIANAGDPRPELHRVIAAWLNEATETGNSLKAG